jgi:hypothetical protein
MEKVFNLLLYVLIAAGFCRVHIVLLPLHFLLPTQLIPSATAEAEPRRTAESCGRNRLLSGKLLAEFRGKLTILSVARSVNSTFVLYGQKGLRGRSLGGNEACGDRKPRRESSGLPGARFHSCVGIPPFDRSGRRRGR